jgi:hypothetical protein
VKVCCPCRKEGLTRVLESSVENASGQCWIAGMRDAHWRTTMLSPERSSAFKRAVVNGALVSCIMGGVALLGWTCGVGETARVRFVSTTMLSGRRGFCAPCPYKLD